MQYIYLPTLLSLTTAGIKLLRVPLLLVFLSVQAYSELVFYLFAFGFFIAFEQIICSLFINSLSPLENSRDITSGIGRDLRFTLWIAQLLGGLILFTNDNFTDSYSFDSLIFITICLFTSIWAYLKIMVTICALEVYDHLIHNRIFKLIGELAFIGLVALLLFFESKVEVAVAAYTASILFVLYLARRSLKRYAITVKVEMLANQKSPISKQYRAQMAVQGINVFAHALPMLVLGNSAMPGQIAFYFIAAQLYQVGPLILYPILTAQYPRLRLKAGEYDYSFFKISASVTVLISIIYTLMYILMPMILEVWTLGSVVTNQELLLYLHAISIIAIIHICLKYYIISKDLAASLFGLYLFASGLALVAFGVTMIHGSIIMAAFSFTFVFEMSAICFVVYKIRERNKFTFLNKND